MLYRVFLAEERASLAEQKKMAKGMTSIVTLDQRERGET